MAYRVSPLPPLGVVPLAALPGVFSPDTSVSQGAPAGTPTQIRWNPSDKAANCVLSNSNRTLTSSSGNQGARSIQSYASGKYYGEITYDAIGTNNCFFGLVTSNTSLTAADTTGSYVQNGLLQSSGGNFLQMSTYAATIVRSALYYDAGSGLGSFQTLIVALTFRWAADFGAGKIWFGPPGGWLGDPAAGTSPAATFTGGSLALFLWGFTNTLGQISIPTSTVYVAPAGFLVA